MHVLTSLLLPLLTTAIPTTSITHNTALHNLAAATADSDLCALPAPGDNCAGAAMRDVIITYQNATEQLQELYLGAARDAGMKMGLEYGGFGFSGFVPDQVVSLIKAAGQQHGVRVHENACSGIPWCGEAPC